MKEAMHEDILQIARQIVADGKNVVFTGAGISTESGIPDYRSKGGIWDRHKPVLFEEFMSSHEARIEYWRRKSQLYPELMNAEPNAAHNALVELYEMGLLETVITQNIDGLHQKAGLPDEAVIELHGNSRRVRCMTCGKISSLREAYQRIQAGELAPQCDCGGFLKPDTISFGQMMPVEEVRRATLLAQSCDFFLVIGSTLIVHPAALMPDYAKRHGAFLSILTLSETPYDEMCDVLIHGKAGEVTQKIVCAVQRLRHNNR